MKLTASREDLLAPLQSVIGVVERRQTMPVLANVLLAARDNKLSITGMVWRRSTTPMTLCRGARRSSREAVSFMEMTLCNKNLISRRLFSYRNYRGAV
jgi:DNA polymerase III sliding clamp (beta) subunit (PCNA family)